MGKTWDGTGIAFSSELWEGVFRVLRPGGVVKAFGGTRTFHRMAVAMAAAGFVDIRITAWTYGSGFPKSLSLSKSFDKMHGAKRGTKRVPFTGNALMRSGGQNTRPWMEKALEQGYHELPDDSPVTDDAKLWVGWGTALKPAWEPVLVGRKPGTSA
jgi:site-specific DNA-methyltransferase (adenine-specific)